MGLEINKRRFITIIVVYFKLRIGAEMKKAFVVILMCSLILSVSAQDAITTSVIALVNSARTRMDLPVLLQSAELNLAAQQHSNDMANNERLNHVGSDGSQFWERMSNAGYALTTGAENILSRSDTNAQAVFNQWWNSPPHQANMISPEYVEIGVGYAQANDGTYYFTMVLGKRDGVVAPAVTSPTPLPPTNTPLQPTFTPIPPTATNTPLPSATPTATPRIPPTRTLSPLITPVYFTPAPQVTHDIATPTATQEILPDIRLVYDSDVLTLINISGRRLDLTDLRFQSDSARMETTVWDTEFLTERLDNFRSDDCLQVWGTQFRELEDIPEDCAIRHGWVAVNDAQLFWQDVNRFFVLNDGDVIGECSVFDGACDVSLEAELRLESDETQLLTTTDRDIRLIFNQDSVTLLNITDAPIDLRGLIFRSGSGRLSIKQWNTEFLTASLGGLPAEDCLMVWITEVDEQPPPFECETRHGWIVATDTEDFWRDTSRFEVVRDNRVLAGCVVANGFCDVSLAGNLGANSPTVVPVNPSSPTGTPIVASGAQSTSSTDLMMVYSLDSFGIINTSGQLLDMTGLVFESESGVFVATRWQTDFLSQPLNAIPTGDCLQVWGVNEQLQSKPANCNTRHGWVAVASEAQFWRDVAQFRVRYGSDYLGTCDARAGQCGLNFP